jgi:hypothetical protein
MKTNKILLGGVAGGVTFFLLGWLVYGVLLKDYMASHLNQCAAKPMQEMILWAMFLSNLALGFLLALIFSWSNTSGMKNGAKLAAIVGALICTSYDLGTYSMSNMFSCYTVMLVDVLSYTVMLAIVGGVVGKVMEKKEA